MKQIKTLWYLRRVLLLQDGVGRTDGQLLESFIGKKDEVAFEALIHRHGPMVLGVCRRILRNHHDAEDAFQATFLVLVGKASTVWPKEMVGNWLHGVAYRIALKARALAARRQKREKQYKETPESEAPPQNPGIELYPLIDRELNCLPVNYRLPIVLCYLEGRTIQEATEQLGWPQGTLAGRLARGKKMLAKRLARRGVGLFAGLPAAILSADAISAGIPPSLIGSTVKAATAIKAGNAPMVGVVPAKVAILMKAAKKTLMPTKLKIVSTIILTLCAAAFGSGLLARYSAGQQLKPEKAENEPTNRKADNTPKSLDEKLCGEWISKKGNVTFCWIFRPDHTIQRITDFRIAEPKDGGNYSVDWNKNPYLLNVKFEGCPGGQTIMEFTQDGKLRIELSTQDDGPPKKFSDDSVVLTKKEKPPAGSKRAAEDAEKDLATAAERRRNGKFGSAHFYYELVQNRYPNSTYAKLAKEGMEELKKKYVGKREDGSEEWLELENEAAVEIYDLGRQVQMLQDRIISLLEKENRPPSPIISQPPPLPPRMIQPPPRANGEKEKPEPPPKAETSAKASTVEIEEFRQQVKKLESWLEALEAKSNKKGNTEKHTNVEK